MEPGDADLYGRAARRAVERETSALVAEHPDWLGRLLGNRPIDVAGAHTWDDAAGEIARWRLTHDLTPDIAGIGFRPDSAEIGEAWDQLHGRLGLTRTWIDTTDRHNPIDLTPPDAPQLMARLDQLDDLFAAAPADWRPVIRALQDGQLSMEDTAALLQEALTGQDARQAWIIRNWPHVVEYHEINRTLDHLVEPAIQPHQTDLTYDTEGIDI